MWRYSVVPACQLAVSPLEMPFSLLLLLLRHREHASKQGVSSVAATGLHICAPAKVLYAGSMHSDIAAGGTRAFPPAWGEPHSAGIPSPAHSDWLADWLAGSSHDHAACSRLGPHADECWHAVMLHAGCAEPGGAAPAS